eukprot:jgi/Ulvmu1/4066/UM019_0044.1
MASSAVVTAVVVSWYTCNMLVAFTNKALLSNFGLQYPFLLTLFHMVTCTTFCAIIHLTGIMPIEPCRTKAQFSKISVLSTVFCLSVVFGNISLKYIPVSFNQAISATTPFFTAVGSFLVLRKRESTATYATLIPVVGGIVIASRFEPSFHAIGFLACLLATSMRALKSILQGILLQDSEKLGSIALLAHMAPVSALLLLPMTAYFEPGALQVAWKSAAGSATFSILLFSNCLLSFFVNLTNFLVTKFCGALTLQVLGNAKGVVAAVVSVLIFHNPVSYIGWGGFAVTMAGVAMYSEARRRASGRRRGPRSPAWEANPVPPGKDGDA